MTKEQLRQILRTNVLLACSVWQPDRLVQLEEVFSEYMECGANVLIAPTFLSRNQEKQAEILAQTALAAGDKAFCAGAIMPPDGGLSLYGGTLPYDTYYSQIYEEAHWLTESETASFLFLLNFTNLLEAKCAVYAAKEAGELPICIGLTFGADGTLEGGEDPSMAVIALQSLGVSAVGVTGQTIDSTLDCLLDMKEFAAVPLFAVALVESFIAPHEFAEYTLSLVRAKCALIGAGVGAEPRYIAQIAKELWQTDPFPPDFPTVNAVVAAGGMCFMDFAGKVVGENKNLIEIALREETDVDEIIQRLIASGMPPVCFRVNDPDALTRAVMLYPGRPAVKSDEYGEITARDYGALVIQD